MNKDALIQQSQIGKLLEAADQLKDLHAYLWEVGDASDFNSDMPRIETQTKMVDLACAYTLKAAETLEALVKRIEGPRASWKKAAEEDLFDDYVPRRGPGKDLREKPLPPQWEDQRIEERQRRRRVIPKPFYPNSITTPGERDAIREMEEEYRAMQEEGFEDPVFQGTRIASIITEAIQEVLGKISDELFEKIDQDVYQWVDKMGKKYDCGEFGSKPNNVKEANELWSALNREMDSLLDKLKAKYDLSDYDRDSLIEGYILDIVGDMSGYDPDTRTPWEMFS